MLRIGLRSPPCISHDQAVLAAAIHCQTLPRSVGAARANVAHTRLSRAHPEPLLVSRASDSEPRVLTSKESGGSQSPARSERSEAATIMGEINLEEGVPEGEERWRDEGGSGESTHFHAHGWRPDPVLSGQAHQDATDPAVAPPTVRVADGDAVGERDAPGES